jgi:hypothetical protein
LGCTGSVRCLFALLQNRLSIEEFTGMYRENDYRYRY